MEDLKRILAAMITAALISVTLMLAGVILLRTVDPFGDVQELTFENVLAIAVLSFISVFFGAIIGLAIAAFKLRFFAGAIAGVFIKGVPGALIFLLLVSSGEHPGDEQRYLFPLVLAAMYAFYGGVAGLASAYVSGRFLRASKQSGALPEPPPPEHFDLDN